MRSLLILPTVGLLAVSTACSARTSNNADSSSTGRVAESGAQPSGCSPRETRAANAPEQSPAFAGQTRACAATSSVATEVTVVAKGLQKPWAVEPLPNGDLLVTEKPGRLRIVSASGTIGEPISGVPAVDGRGQGGLLDIALSPGFTTDRTIFWSFTEPRDGGNGTSVARGALSPDNRSLADVKVIFRAMPTYNNNMHFGSRLAFGPDGKLFITTGERSDTPMRPQAQAF
ncbi:MAG TPA: PQQ-dependent sugar dehydrogenase, partial [Gemmatimonas sp.]|nr:PQQ-dependent sugar dehydrogenase [Gemmatimonas sp.]